MTGRRSDEQEYSRTQKFEIENIDSLGARHSGSEGLVVGGDVGETESGNQSMLLFALRWLRATGRPIRCTCFYSECFAGRVLVPVLLLSMMS